MNGSDWTIKHESAFKAHNQICSKSIDLSSMGKRVLTSHAQSNGHEKVIAKRQIQPYVVFKCEEKSSNKMN